MKAIKSCHWRYLWKHKFQGPENVRLNTPVRDHHFYDRWCTRCGLFQRISVTLGLHFLEEELGGKK